MTKQEEDAWIAEVDLHKDDREWLYRLHHRMRKRKPQPWLLLGTIALRLNAIWLKDGHKRQGRRAY